MHFVLKILISRGVECWIPLQTSLRYCFRNSSAVASLVNCRVAQWLLAAKMLAMAALEAMAPRWRPGRFFSWDFCWLLGGFSPTHLKNMLVKLEIIFPNFQGENKKLFETTT